MSKRIPLLEEVLKYQKEKNLILSMPGNKSGIGFLRDDIGKEFVNNMGFLDITEVDPLDNLHCPEGIIKEAQDLLAKTYGSKKAYFVVNGSTAGNLASIFDAFNEGYEESEFMKIFKEYNVEKVIYGHLHGLGRFKAKTGIINEIEYIMTSCDFIDFNPVRIL